MAKQRKKGAQAPLLAPTQPSGTLSAQRRRSLFLATFLKEETRKKAHELRDECSRAHAILCRWADLQDKGFLDQKEKALDADFLFQVFGDALGYLPATRATANGQSTYQLQREFHVAGVGTADGAIGEFELGVDKSPVAIIELKSADTRLDTDRFNGRTSIQQCWDYLNGLPECQWAIVSNFVSIRLYHRDRGSRTFEVYTLQELRNAERFAEFYHVLGRGGLLPTKLQKRPRAEILLDQAGNRQRTVGDELYVAYSENRLYLIDHLHRRLGKPLDSAISIAQKLMDRIIFIAFCEDRGLLPERLIERTYTELPPLARVTNPRWRNFLDLFHAVDTGHRDLMLNGGYNGGLFRYDAEVDNLQLEDEWTSFFRAVGRYDFRDEVNVDVLGHLFEMSITELERIRAAGLFEDGDADETPPARMQKSAQRKRFGIYYTPPEFTGFIVEKTVGAVVDERLAELGRKHGVDPKGTNGHKSAHDISAFWREAVDVLRGIRVCDPACGSGAFLINAYEYLEERYSEVIDNLIIGAHPDAEMLAAQAPDMILNENLFGVDVFPEAVEITQLALWIRSARKGRTLADLSQNIVCGNSLVDDPAVHELALKWEEAFPQVFADNGGFDCVIGNPPWERLKVQEREHFAYVAPEIAGAVSAATRRELISALERTRPQVYAKYVRAQKDAEKALDYTRSSGRYPLTGKGDVNSYALFAELARSIVSPTGRVGLLVPSGIASDKTTMHFFRQLVADRSLLLLYDFENRKRVFPDVDSRFKFSTLIFGGSAFRVSTADFVFFAHSVEELSEANRHISLSADDMELVNPNTHTCPVFRHRRDAEITKAIYRRVPILVDRTRTEGGNPWGAKFLRMFDQTNDAELFHSAAQLTQMRYRQEGNRWRRGNSVFLPLYEAKMVQAYDHRAASVTVDPDNWVRQGQTVPSSLVQHQNPEFVVQPRWWVDERGVVERFGQQRPQGFLGFKDITSPTNERTMIAAQICWSAVTNHFPLILTSASPRLEACLLANLNALVLDYVARQKIGGVTLNFFIVEQLPILPPDLYYEKCPWSPRQSLEKWISDRVLKLTCTANDMLPLAEAVGFRKGVHKWNSADRAQLRAQLDAAYFRLYGVSRGDVEYILSTFTGTERRDVGDVGTYRTAELVLDAYDALA